MAEPGDPIKGWRVEVTCPGCGSQLRHVAAGDGGDRPVVTDSRALARCSRCRRYWLAVLDLFDATETVREQEARDPVADREYVHGSRSGYVRGCRLPCCAEPERVFQRERSRRRRAAAKAEREAKAS